MALSDQYVPGQTVRLIANFTNLSGSAIDPSVVTFKLIDAQGNESVYNAPTNDSVGIFHQDIYITNVPGPWWYRATAATPTTAQEQTFTVLPQRVP